MTPTTQPQTEGLLTAEQYGALPDDGRLTELVCGRIVELPAPPPIHWQVSVNIAGVLLDYAGPRQLGRVNCGYCGIVTTRGPDTVRTADATFWSNSRSPTVPADNGFGPSPELVFEVWAPTDRMSETLFRIAEYHEAGVQVVGVIDPRIEVLVVFPQDELLRRYTADEELTLPEVFSDFRVRVRQFLE